MAYSNEFFNDIFDRTDADCHIGHVSRRFTNDNCCAAAAARAKSAFSRLGTWQNAQDPDRQYLTDASIELMQ
jgi:hypothetical protein